VLTYSLTKWLVFEENLQVLVGVFLPFQVFFSFIGVLSVANRIQVRKRISCLFVVEPACALNKRRKWLRPFRLFTLLVLELWSFDGFATVRALKRSLVGNFNLRSKRSAASQLVVVFAWIDIRIIYAVWNQRPESLVGTLRRIYNDTFDLSNFRSFFSYDSVTHLALTVSLIVRTCITHSQWSCHREHSITRSNLNEV